jgi:hypothetical protein
VIPVYILSAPGERDQDWVAVVDRLARHDVEAHLLAVDYEDTLQRALGELRQRVSLDEPLILCANAFAGLLLSYLHPTHPESSITLVQGITPAGELTTPTVVSTFCRELDSGSKGSVGLPGARFVQSLEPLDTPSRCWVDYIVCTGRGAVPLHLQAAFARGASSRSVWRVGTSKPQLRNSGGLTTHLSFRARLGHPTLNDAVAAATVSHNLTAGPVSDLGEELDPHRAFLMGDDTP